MTTASNNDLSSHVSTLALRPSADFPAEVARRPDTRRDAHRSIVTTMPAEEVDVP